MNNNYKFLLPLAMIYMSIKITTVLLIYKIIIIGGYSVSISTLIIPLWFFIGDIIAEVYGYKIAKQLIWLAIIGQFVFAFICGIVAHIASPSVLYNQIAYEELLSKLPRVAIASFLAISLGGIFNAYAINKWKVLLKGKYFGLRSLGASSIGELIFTICAYLVEFIGMTSSSHIVQLIIISYLVKLALNPLLVIPITVITKIIKRHENIVAFNENKESNLLSYLSQNYGAVSKVTEMYSAKNDKSYFKEVIVQTPITHLLGNYSEKIKVSELMFREFQPNAQFDWHTAPQEQYIIYLDGEVEVITSGGEQKIFKAGDILLAKDLSGKGHITKTLTHGRSIIITL